MKNIYVIVNEVKDIVEAYEDYSVCELAYIKMVNEDIKNRGLLVVTIDQWTDTIEHQYFRYYTSTTDGPCHMYSEYDTNYSIYMKEVILNPILIGHGEQDELEESDVIYSKKS